MFNKRLSLYKTSNQIDAKMVLWDWPQGVLYNFVCLQFTNIDNK
jgi:hypothetical protein